MRLNLNLKRRWFDEIKAGTKRVEYRRVCEFWRARLEGREFDQVEICLGYPKRDDETRRLRFGFGGVTVESIVSDEFGAEPVECYAIKLLDLEQKP